MDRIFSIQAFTDAVIQEAGKAKYHNFFLAEEKLKCHLDEK